MKLVLSPKGYKYIKEEIQRSKSVKYSKLRKKYMYKREKQSHSVDIKTPPDSSLDQVDVFKSCVKSFQPKNIFLREKLNKIVKKASKKIKRNRLLRNEMKKFPLIKIPKKARMRLNNLSFNNEIFKIGKLKKINNKFYQKECKYSSRIRKIHEFFMREKNQEHDETAGKRVMSDIKKLQKKISTIVKNKRTNVMVLPLAINYIGMKKKFKSERKTRSIMKLKHEMKNIYKVTDRYYEQSNSFDLGRRLNESSSDRSFVRRKYLSFDKNIIDRVHSLKFMKKRNIEDEETKEKTNEETSLNQ